MVFTNRVVDDNFHIKFNDVLLEQVSEFCYLGIYIDNRLKFKRHIEHLLSKLSRLCGATFRLSSQFDLVAAKNYYYSFVHSALLYGIAVWGGSLGTQQGQSLQKLQNKIVRNLFSQFYTFESTTELFKVSKIHTIADIYKIRALSYMFRMLKLNWHFSLISSYIQSVEHSHFTRYTGCLRPPFPRVTSVRQAFPHQFVGLWNDLPPDIRDISSLTAFRRALMCRLTDSSVPES